tara:strand:+ start:3018 stop:3332 length:315 start_codon:yes stop_codon:yes gene_type:complete
MSLQETKSKIASSEFTLWKVYFQKEHQRFHREDYLFAMVAAEVRRTVAKYPEKVKLEHFLLDFGGKEKKKESKMTDSQKSDASKSMWLTVVGLNPEDPNEKKDS